MTTSEFIFDWKMDWKEFATLRDVAEIKSGFFIISKNNAPYVFQASLRNQDIGNPQARFQILAVFHHGFKKMTYQFSSATIKIPHQNEETYRYLGVPPCDKTEFQHKFNLTDDQPLLFHLTFEMKDEYFNGVCHNFPELKPSPRNIIKAYEKVQNQATAGDLLSELSDVKFLSSDGVQFYGHRIILASHSDTLATLFSRSADEGNEEKIFAEMHSTTLKLFLQFLYTGVVDFFDMQPQTLVDLLDAGERYDLATLKEACVSVLEMKMMENPKIAPVVVIAANTYNYKTLKLRAIDVFIDNYHRLNFGGGASKSRIFGAILLDEILDFSVARMRVRPKETIPII